jgi:hypothetical protein
MSLVISSPHPHFTYLSYVSSLPSGLFEDSPPFSDADVLHSLVVPCCLSGQPSRHAIQDIPLPPGVVKFLSLRGNSFSVSDILSFFSTLPSEELARLMKYFDYMRGLRPLQTFSCVSHPYTSKGAPSQMQCGSYRLVNWVTSRPICSGSRVSEARLLNIDWQADGLRGTSEDSTRKERLAAPNDVLEEAEDAYAELDHRIAQNRSVYRLLWLSEGASVYTTPIVVRELSEIYDKRGPLMASLLALSPEACLPMVLDRLKDRYFALMSEKLTRMSDWCKSFELHLPVQRTRTCPVTVDVPLPMLGRGGETVFHFRVGLTFLLLELIDAAVGAHGLEEREVDPVQSSIRELVLNMRSDLWDHQCGFPRAAALASGALLLQKFDEIPLIDSPEIHSGVQLAIDIGLTCPEQHGCSRIVRILGQAAVRNLKVSTLKKKATAAVRQIAGLFVEIDLTRAAQLWKLTQAFFRAIRLLARNGDGFPCIWCLIQSGALSFRGEGGQPVEVDFRTIPAV